jgi:hypothetical protein
VNVFLGVQIEVSRLRVNGDITFTPSRGKALKTLRLIDSCELTDYMSGAQASKIFGKDWLCSIVVVWKVR